MDVSTERASAFDADDVSGDAAGGKEHEDEGGGVEEVVHDGSPLWVVAVVV